MNNISERYLYLHRRLLNTTDINEIRAINVEIMKLHDKLYGGADDYECYKKWEELDKTTPVLNNNIALNNSTAVNVMDKHQLYQRAKEFLSRENIYKQLHTAIGFLIPHRSDVELVLNIGGGSYTDNKKVVIGLPEYFMGMSYYQMYIALRALAGHECQHVNSSNFSAFRLFIQDFGKYFKDKYNIPSYIGERIGKHLANSLEDGRIEKILCNRLPGYIRYLKFLNGTIREKQPVKGDSELGDFMYTITMISVTGLYPKGYKDIYKGTELHENIKKIKSLIIDGINAVTCKDCLNICWEIAHEVEDYLVNLLKQQAEEDQNFINSIPQQIEFADSDERDTNDSREISVHFKPEDKNKDKDENEEDEDKEGQGSGSSDDKKDKESDEDSKKGSGSSSDKDDGEEYEKESDDNSDDKSSSSQDKDTEDSSSNDKKDSKDKNSKDSKSDKDEKELSSQDKDDADSSSTQDETSSSSDNFNPSGDEDDFDDEDSLVDETLKLMDEDLKREVEEKLKSDTKKDVVKDRKEEKTKLSEKDIKQFEEQYKDERVRKFREIKGFTVNSSLPLELKRDGNKLRKEFEKILKDKESIHLKNQKKGILDTNSLYRIAFRDYNVFEVKGTPNQTTFVAYILQDGSGSMTSENKQLHSTKALAILEEGLKGLIPLKMATFCVDGYGGHVTHFCIKDFNENNSNNLAWNFNNHRRASGGNKDGYSIRVATKELLKRPEMNKILVVLSDGLPSDYNGGSKAGMEDVKKAVKEARSKGILVISMMFGSEHFQDYNFENYKYMYERNLIACKPEDITNHLIKMFRKVIRNG